MIGTPMTRHAWIASTKPTETVNANRRKRSAGRDRSGLESADKDPGTERGDSRSHGKERDSGQEKALESKQKSVETDLEM